MQDSLLNEGLTLMLAGMGTVFAFLTTLVIMMSVMSSIVARLLAMDAGPSEDEIAAIAAVIEKHRSK